MKKRGALHDASVLVDGIIFASGAGDDGGEPGKNPARCLRRAHCFTKRTAVTLRT